MLVLRITRSLRVLSMTHERWVELMENDTIRLTPEEIEEGWHFCWDWDGLLIHPGDDEFELCHCRGAQDERDPARD